MTNGGKLLTPHLPGRVEENPQFKTEVRRRINVDNETWKRMVPGMIGAVNYGSGRKAYRPDQTVAGKTGTCIGQGGWLGLFTSYAPVVNPRLAVVVITRGSDARRHLPAAVAGNIYRALSPRFGTLINFQVAQTDEESTTDTTDKKAAALNEEAAETKAAAESEENGAEGTNGADTANTNLNASGAPRTELKSKTKSTTMPVGARGSEGTARPTRPSPSSGSNGKSKRP